MPVSSVIIEVEQGAESAVLGDIARVPLTSVFGIKDRQIVTVIEGDDLASVEQSLRQLSALDRVIGVYPVYAGED